jgi:hypothetical protein
LTGITKGAFFTVYEPFDPEELIEQLYVEPDEVHVIYSPGTYIPKLS